MPRPPLPEGEQHDACLRIYCREEERQAFERVAQQFGVSGSQLGHLAILSLLYVVTVSKTPQGDTWEATTRAALGVELFGPCNSG